MKQILKAVILLIFLLAVLPVGAQVQVQQSQLEKLPNLAEEVLIMDGRLVLLVYITID